MNQNNSTMIGTAVSLSFLFIIKLFFIFLMISSPAAATDAVETENTEVNEKQSKSDFLWHPSKLFSKDYLLSSSYNNNNNNKDNNKNAVNNEDILEKLMRIDAVHADAIEAKINSLLIPRDLQHEKIIKGIYEEKKSLEKAIAVVQESVAVNKNIIIDKLESRKDAADRRLQEILNKSKETLMNVNTFLEFIQNQKETNELKPNENKNQSEKINVTFEILQKKKNILENYLKELEPENAI